MINYIRPSVQYANYVFEEIGVHNWSRAVTLNITFIPSRLTTDSIRSQIPLFQPPLGGELRVDVWEPFANFLYD